MKDPVHTIRNLLYKHRSSLPPALSRPFYRMYGRGKSQRLDEMSRGSSGKAPSGAGKIDKGV